MKKIVVIVSILTLCACSKYASNGESKYMQSRNGANLVVPPPLNGTNISHFYDLPRSHQNTNVSVSIAPETRDQ